MESNKTSDVVLDTRTPPKVKEQQKEKESLEHSHAGIAVPIDEDSITLEEPTKKLNFYKIAKPTTNSGLSTWILLSGQTPPSVQSTTKIEKTTERVNYTLVTDTPNRIVKPIFKKRTTTTTTTAKPKSTTTISSTSSTTTTTAEVEITTKLNKVKASVLHNAKKNTTLIPVKTITTTEQTTTKLTTTENTLKIANVTNNITNVNELDSNSLPLEAKDNEIELTTTAVDVKKTRRPTTKRKKNKNRRRKPATEKTSNSTKIGHKEKPIGTQIYNYLSREVVPTIGVGLVGLMVTAGLASYFLYPFAAARRNYDIDRKDKEGTYHYTDEYESGGIAEEEAIGKVIAGMQTTANYNNYRNYNPKSTYPNVRNIHQSPSDGFQVTPNTIYNDNYDYNNKYQTETYQNSKYSNDVIEQSKETSYSVDDKKFVVGNVPKEVYQEVTPVTVPEHGPRSLRLRKRREADDLENDVFSDTNFARLSSSTTTSVDDLIKPSSITSDVLHSEITTGTSVTSSTTIKAELAPHKSFVNLLKDLFHMKVSLGLQLLQNATESVARYLTRVQKRLDDHYRSTNTTYLYH